MTPGLPPPGALMLNTPATDLTRASDSLKTNAYIDVLLKAGDSSSAALYAHGADLATPYLSPLVWRSPRRAAFRRPI